MSMKNKIHIVGWLFWFLSLSPLVFSQCSFQTITVPVSTLTSSTGTGVNDQGAVVGTFSKSSGISPQGFLLFQGNFSFFTFPPGFPTITGNINNNSQIVGSFLKSGVEHAFVVRNSSFQEIVVPFSNNGAFATGINNNNPGDIVGWFIDPSTGLSISYLRQSNGTFTKFTFPNPGGPTLSTQASGINRNSIIVGTYTDAGGVVHGFMARNGAFQNIDFPGATSTRPGNVNDSNEVVGTYTLSDNSVHGYEQDLTANTFITIDRPGASATSIRGVNNNDQITGSNVIASNTTAFQGNCVSVF
jgi:hypothetical protein